MKIQGLSQDIENGCPELAIVKIFFKGEHNILHDTLLLSGCTKNSWLNFLYSFCSLSNIRQLQVKPILHIQIWSKVKMGVSGKVDDDDDDDDDG